MTSSCPAGWVEVNTTCYGFLEADPSVSSYTDVETMCKDEGGSTATLAVIPDAATVAQMNSVMPSISNQYFIGVRSILVCIFKLSHRGLKSFSTCI